jgi:hypothetical protein
MAEFQMKQKGIMAALPNSDVTTESNRYITLKAPALGFFQINGLQLQSGIKIQDLIQKCQYIFGIRMHHIVAPPAACR